MKTALVIGASGGIGQAISAELTSRGCQVTDLSRSRDGLDIRSEASIKVALDRLEGPFDLIFIATGALQIDGATPEKSLRHLTDTALQDQFAVNATGPALIVKHSLRLMSRDKLCVIAALSARVGSIGDNRLGGWYSYRAAKAALNQIIHSAAIEIARTHKKAVCVALHPGTVATPFTKDFVSPDKATPPDETAKSLLDVITTLTPAETGNFYDYAGKPIRW
jgi:NAD(P)-dependent dehydrogenase (short-subunit alcohol dehydrogenase family)